MIGIIGAMDIEVESIKALLTDTKEEVLSGVTFVRGKYGSNEVVAAKCGVGKVFAALCAEAMIIRYCPEAIINVGVAGALSADLRIGDIVVAEAVLQHDMDTSPLGDPVGLISGINLIDIPCSADVCKKLCRSVEKAGFKYKIGKIASGDCFVAENSKKQFIADTFGAVSCEMEGAGIGQVCYVNNVPFAVLRAMSDGADNGADMDYPTFARMAARNTTKVIKEFLS